MHRRRLLAFAVILVACGDLSSTVSSRPEYAPRRSSPHRKPAEAIAARDPRGAESNAGYAALDAGLFGGRDQSPLPVAAPSPVAKARGVLPPVRSIPAAPEPDPLAGYVYSGTIAGGGETWALIENPTTHESWYVHAGDRWHGLGVLTVNASKLELQDGDRTRSLPKSDAFNAVPLTHGQSIDGQTIADSESNQPLDVAVTLNTGRLDQSILRAFLLWSKGGLSQAEIEHMKDQVFSGKMTTEEYDQKVNGASTGVEVLNYHVIFTGAGPEETRSDEQPLILDREYESAARE